MNIRKLAIDHVQEYFRSNTTAEKCMVDLLTSFGELVTSEMKTESQDSFGQNYKSKWILAETIINAVGSAIDGEELSDFELSFPIVRKALDIYEHLQAVSADPSTDTAMEGFKSGDASTYVSTNLEDKEGQPTQDPGKVSSDEVIDNADEGDVMEFFKVPKKFGGEG